VSEEREASGWKRKASHGFDVEVEQCDPTAAAEVVGGLDLSAELCQLRLHDRVSDDGRLRGLLVNLCSTIFAWTIGRLTYFLVLRSIGLLQKTTTAML
jgi:hypothetical protein